MTLTSPLHPSPRLERESKSWTSHEGGHSMPRGQKFTAEQIIAKLREAEVELARGKKVPEAAKQIVGPSQTSFNNFRTKYS